MSERMKKKEVEDKLTKEGKRKIEEAFERFAEKYKLTEEEEREFDAICQVNEELLGPISKEERMEKNDSEIEFSKWLKEQIRIGNLVSIKKDFKSSISLGGKKHTFTRETVPEGFFYYMEPYNYQVVRVGGEKYFYRPMYSCDSLEIVDKSGTQKLLSKGDIKALYYIKERLTIKNEINVMNKLIKYFEDKK